MRLQGNFFLAEAYRYRDSFRQVGQLETVFPFLQLGMDEVTFRKSHFIVQ